MMCPVNSTSKPETLKSPVVVISPRLESEIIEISPPAVPTSSLAIIVELIITSFPAVSEISWVSA